MDKIYHIIEMFVLSGTVLAVTFAVLISLPKSKMREFLMPIIGWCVAIFCGIYCISPVDILPEVLLGPFGLVDDIGAVVAGISAAHAAMNPKKD